MIAAASVFVKREMVKRGVVSFKKQSDKLEFGGLKGASPGGEAVAAGD